MPRPLAPVVLLVLEAWASGCRPRAIAGSDAGLGGPALATAVVSAPPPADGGRPMDATPSDCNALQDLLDPFLDLVRPDFLPLGHDQWEPYRQKAAVLLNCHVGRLPASEAGVVAEVLAHSTDPRAAPALLAWGLRSKSGTMDVIRAMGAHPRPAYMALVEAILADNDMAAVITTETTYGALGDVLGTVVQGSAHVAALDLAARLPGAEGRGLVRRIAEDPAAGVINPRTYAALRCEPELRRIEFEAQALSNLRIMALSILGDVGLMLRIGNDHREPWLVRTWALRMATGDLDKPAPKSPSKSDRFARLLVFDEPPKFYGSPCF